MRKTCVQSVSGDIVSFSQIFIFVLHDQASRFMNQFWKRLSKKTCNKLFTYLSILPVGDAMLALELQRSSTMSAVADRTQGQMFLANSWGREITQQLLELKATRGESPETFGVFVVVRTWQLLLSIITFSETLLPIGVVPKNISYFACASFQIKGLSQRDVGNFVERPFPLGFSRPGGFADGKNDGRARPSPLRILRRMMLQKDIFAFAPSVMMMAVWFVAKRWEDYLRSTLHWEGGTEVGS